MENPNNNAPNLIGLMSLIQGFGPAEPGKQPMAAEFPQAYPALGFSREMPSPPMTAAPPAWLEPFLGATMQPVTMSQGDAVPIPQPASPKETAQETQQIYTEAEIAKAQAMARPDTGGDEPVTTGKAPESVAQAQIPGGPVASYEYTMPANGPMYEGPPKTQEQEMQSPQFTPASPEEILGPELWAQLQQRANARPGWLQWLGAGLAGSFDPAMAERGMDKWQADRLQAQNQLADVAANTSRYNLETQRQLTTERRQERQQQQITDREMARQRGYNYRSILTQLKSPTARAKLLEAQPYATKLSLTPEEEAAFERLNTEAMVIESDYLNDQEITGEVMKLAPLVGRGDAPRELLDFTINKIKDPNEKALVTQVASRLAEEGGKIRAAKVQAATSGVEAARIRAEATKLVAQIQAAGRLNTTAIEIAKTKAAALALKNSSSVEINKVRNQMTDPMLDDTARASLAQTLFELETTGDQINQQLMTLDMMNDSMQQTGSVTGQGVPGQLGGPSAGPGVVPSRTEPVVRERVDTALPRVWASAMSTAVQRGMISNPAAVGAGTDPKAVERYLLLQGSASEWEYVADIILDNMESVTGMERDKLVEVINGEIARRYPEAARSQWAITRGTRSFMGWDTPAQISPQGPAALNTVNMPGTDTPSNILFKQENK